LKFQTSFLCFLFAFLCVQWIFVALALAQSRDSGKLVQSLIFVIHLMFIHVLMHVQVQQPQQHVNERKWHRSKEFM